MLREVVSQDYGGVVLSGQRAPCILSCLDTVLTKPTQNGVCPAKSPRCAIFFRVTFFLLSLVCSSIEYHLSPRITFGHACSSELEMHFVARHCTSTEIFVSMPLSSLLPDFSSLGVFDSLFQMFWLFKGVSGQRA